MEKHTTTYDITLDPVDVQTISSRPRQDGTETMPLWSGQHAEEYYRFEVVEPDYSTVSCHICNVKVPAKYIKEHKSSEKHKICMKIADTALQRIKDNILTDAQSLDTESVDGYFCEPCSVIVTDENHEISGIHKSSLLHDKLLKDLLLVYSEKSNINNIDLKYLTDSRGVEKNNTGSSDYKNNSELRGPNYCKNKNFEGNDEIDDLTEFEIKDIESNIQIKYPTEGKNIENNNKITYPTVCNIDLESNDKISYSTKPKIEDIKSNMEIKNLLQDKEKYLENNNEVTYPTDSKNKNIKDDGQIKNKEIKKKQDMNDAVNEQIIYKHTTIITDLKSMKSYFKILMEIFSQTSLIYVYINRMVIGINIGRYKLKVRVDSFLGINGDSNRCLLCSSKFTDREEHIYDIEHMKKVMVPIKDQHCIRQINETRYYCLLCASVIDNKNNNKYTGMKNLAEIVTAHVISQNHKTNFYRALYFEAFKNRQVDLTTFTSKTFCDEHICNVCGLFVSNSVIKDRCTGNINNSKYRKYFCATCQKIMPLKSQLEHIEDKGNKPENYDYVLHPTHAIKTYCGACDLYIDTHYLDNHTTGKKHKEKIRCNARLNKLAKTKPELEQKAVRITDWSKRSLTSIANEVLGNLLWAQMEISKNPKEVICRVCNTVVPKAWKDVQNHIKGENHQEQFGYMLLSCNSSMETNPGLEQICLRTNAKAKIVKCEICNISIPNIPKTIELHVNGIEHQNKLNAKLLPCDVEKNKTHYAQAVSSNQTTTSRYMKPVEEPSNTKDVAVTTNKGQRIPIEGTSKLSQNSNKNEGRRLHPLVHFKEDVRPVNAQADTNQVNRSNNSERIAAMFPYQIQSATTYMNPDAKHHKAVFSNKVKPIQNLNKQNKKKNRKDKGRIVRPPVYFQEEINPKTNKQRITPEAPYQIQSTTNGDPQIKSNEKIVNKMRYLIEKSADLKQNNCIVCKIDFPLSESYVSDHLLGEEHNKNYRIMLSSNCIEERSGGRPGKLHCRICNYDIRNAMCALLHIEGMVHQTRMKPFLPSKSGSNIDQKDFEI